MIFRKTTEKPHPKSTRFISIGFQNAHVIQCDAPYRRGKDNIMHQLA